MEPPTLCQRLWRWSSPVAVSSNHLPSIHSFSLQRFQEFSSSVWSSLSGLNGNLSRKSLVLRVLFLCVFLVGCCSCRLKGFPCFESSSPTDAPTLFVRQDSRLPASQEWLYLLPMRCIQEGQSSGMVASLRVLLFFERHHPEGLTNPPFPSVLHTCNSVHL